jgi:hypothetical protein
LSSWALIGCNQFVQLGKFYQSVQLENAMLEVYDLVLSMGHWGDEIKIRKATIKPLNNM